VQVLLFVGLSVGQSVWPPAEVSMHDQVPSWRQKHVFWP
jgi:hypothetical protein